MRFSLDYCEPTPLFASFLKYIIDIKVWAGSLSNKPSSLDHSFSSSIQSAKNEKMALLHFVFAFLILPKR